MSKKYGKSIEKPYFCLFPVPSRMEGAIVQFGIWAPVCGDWLRVTDARLNWPVQDLHISLSDQADGYTAISEGKKWRLT